MPHFHSMVSRDRPWPSLYPPTTVDPLSLATNVLLLFSRLAQPHKRRIHLNRRLRNLSPCRVKIEWIVLEELEIEIPVQALDTETATVSGTVSANQIQHMPSFGRDVIKLAQLAPGVFGNALPEYAAMGSPLDPTPPQVAHLNRKTALPAPESLRIQDNKLHVQLSANDLVLIVLRP